MILLLTSVPVPATPVDGIPGIDKGVHLVLYAVLGWLSARAALGEGAGWRGAAAALLGVLLFAALDEWHQGFVAGRSADPNDWLADAAGALLGTALAARALLRSERFT